MQAGLKRWCWPTLVVSIPRFSQVADRDLRLVRWWRSCGPWQEEDLEGFARKAERVGATKVYVEDLALRISCATSSFPPVRGQRRL